MVYEWKHRTGMHGVKAQDAGAYFERLEERDGEIIPENVVDEARPETALLHPIFEWDDRKAAEKYRVQQAQGIIRNIVIVQERQDDNPPIAVRAVINVEPVEELGLPNTGGEYTRAKYQMLKTAMMHDETRHTVLENAKRELSAVKRRYRDVQELAEVWAAIERVGA